MATYDYLCKTCGKQFEHVQSMKDNALTECLCGKNGTVERMITGTAGIIFKGSGFYVTDYKKDSGNKAPSPTAPKTDAPPQATTGEKAPESSNVPSPTQSKTASE